jgi:hypothetical protein
MAKVYIERAYIEPMEEKQSHQILIHIKEGNTHTYVGKVELDHNVAWMHFDTDKNNDLLINSSAGIEGNKWNHILHEIIENDFGIGNTIEIEGE